MVTTTRAKGSICRSIGRLVVPYGLRKERREDGSQCTRSLAYLAIGRNVNFPLRHFRNETQSSRRQINGGR